MTNRVSFGIFTPLSLMSVGLSAYGIPLVVTTALPFLSDVEVALLTSQSTPTIKAIRQNTINFFILFYIKNINLHNTTPRRNAMLIAPMLTTRNHLLMDLSFATHFDNSHKRYISTISRHNAITIQSIINLNLIKVTCQMLMQFLCQTNHKTGRVHIQNNDSHSRYMLHTLCRLHIRW